MNGYLTYFQIGVFIMYVSLFTWRILYLHLHERVRAVSLIARGNRLRGFLTISLISSLVAWFVIMMAGILYPDSRFLPFPLGARLLDSLHTELIGVVLVALGFAFFISAWIRLGNFWRVGNREEKNNELITEGVYGISRNPIYLFFVLYLSGIFLINGTLIFLIFAVMVALNLHYLTLEEESFLSRVHGTVYHNYCGVTGRYITWLRIWPMTRIRGCLQSIRYVRNRLTELVDSVPK